MARRRRGQRRGQRGSAMVVVLVIILALLAGGAGVAWTMLTNTRSTELSKTTIQSTYCAEAGLAAAVPVVAAHQPLWAGHLCTTRPYATCAQPAFLDNTAFSHDLDGDGVDDFEVVIADNDDEVFPIPSNPAVDLDRQLFVVARCLQYPDTPHEVAGLVDFSGPSPVRRLYLRTN